ncbi:hypothetical protein CC85DRAFT_284303 [Cutaneotrichosporon oleaginosum]|uniref:Uncharacterized protein n=1 Tax=Cutaneotrichosporon oleaginosum TaxID=879819 RepID=A0A0J1B791_9TREE|nr:uncharacterized protein CC85DRAFT_284303 [Cutaneotrichosporon oleaginosum]KLT43594.1 hypothetical protein CC85DRAFT_284303 [Cutaneotrichosporon oleaginosum]TXT12738.1 hypothetical protein COLE_03148 [Cutaneotrichosporon oleaginosum]
MESILGGRSRPNTLDIDPDLTLDRRKRRRVASRVPLPTPTHSAPSNSAPSASTSPAVTFTALPDLPTPPAASPAHTDPLPPSDQPAPSDPTPTLPHAVLAAGQIRLLSPHDLVTDTLGAYASLRSAIAAATPHPGGLHALQAVLAAGPIAGERNFTVSREALAALNLPLAPATVAVALGLPRAGTAGTGRRMALPFFFASDNLVALFTAMRAGLGALGGLVEAAQLARTRAWLRGRSVPAPPTSGMSAYGLVLGETAELWVMTRGPYFVARAWAGKLGTPEFAGVLASVLGARERAAAVAQCLHTIKAGREALASADRADRADPNAFDTWAGNGGDTPARTFERGLAAVGYADGGARVVAWVRAQDVASYVAVE